MTFPPEFPNFKPIELKDRDYIHDLIWTYQSEVSELTFTNMYIWWHYYRVRWARLDESILFLCDVKKEDPFFLTPVGQEPRLKTAETALLWLRDQGIQSPSLKRVDTRLVDELKHYSGFNIRPTRDHFDYIYRTRDLIDLSGRKYHKKKNHFNRFQKKYKFEYVPMTEKWIKECVEVLKRWCDFRECRENDIMRAEFESVHEALYNFSDLNIFGGIILIQGSVEAFTMGEQLNQKTAVIHVEKANPKIPELFTMINQQFCFHALKDIPFINREQDLGEPGLRQSKLSYHPFHFVEKFEVNLV